MAVNLGVAGLFGRVVPLTLDRLGVDPAVASSVFITTVTDVIGFLSFLGLAALWLLWPARQSLLDPRGGCITIDTR